MRSSDRSLSAGGGRRAQLAGLLRGFDLRAVGVVLAIFLTTRLLLLLVIFLSSAAIPMPSGTFGYASPDNIVIDGLIRHDSWWYVGIIEHGYALGDAQTGAQGTVTFFPLYPLLVKGVAALTGDIFVAGVVVSQLAFLAALGFLYGLARREYDGETAARAIFYLAAAPSTIFCAAMYTESLFIALVCATFYFSGRRMWEWAAAAGALAAATRNTGVLLAAVIALEGLSQQGLRLRPERLLGPTPAATVRLWRDHLGRQARVVLASWPGLLASCYVPIGLVAYMVFLQLTFGDPLGFIHAQASWGRSTGAGSILNILSNITTNLSLGDNIWAGQINTLTLLNLLATLGFAPLVLMVAFKLRPAYAVYTLLTFYAPLSTGSIGSMARYVLMLIPCFLLLAVWGRRGWVDRLVLGVFLPLTAYFAIMFSHWYFVG
ncbi:MAG: glycosyltransferase family 39 protein [Chloroflexales bacterium]